MRCRHRWHHPSDKRRVAPPFHHSDGFHPISPTRGGPAPSFLIFWSAAPPPNQHLSPLPGASVPLYLGWVWLATAVADKKTRRAGRENK
jgi:hypothetical protein